MKKRPSNILPRIEDVTGWILICRDEDDDGNRQGDGWHIAWLDVFGSRKAARQFAEHANWPRNYRAVRGRLLVDHQ